MTNSNKMKSALLKAPEYYLIVLAFLAGYTPPFSINPFFLLIIALLMIQIILKNRVTGLLFGGLFFLASLYFLGAVASELFEFSAFDAAAKQLLFVGVGVGALNLLMSLTMVYKYAVRLRGGYASVLGG